MSDDTDDSKEISTIMKPLKDYKTLDEVKYTWIIDDWASLTKEKYRLPSILCGNYYWNILLFPKGNSNHSSSLSIYLESHTTTPVTASSKESLTGSNLTPESKLSTELSKSISSSESLVPPVAITGSLPSGESVNGNSSSEVCAQFSLVIHNPDHPAAALTNVSSHRFTATETDWGFASLVDERRLKTPKDDGKAILENNKLAITTCIRVIDDHTGVLWHSFMNYDSKKNTGYVGLSNQGATCYLNSLLQSYFTTSIFRKLVYQIPTSPTTSTSVPLALQRTFYLLSKSPGTVSTQELTKSFGWDSSDAFTQHDVQELNRILMDKLEIAMKNSPIENHLNDIFVGKMKSFIKCINVDYESSRIEDYWDIQLNVKTFKNLNQSFANYIEMEMLNGENKYQAGEEFGYQDAKKGVVFQSFPPVLHLQLKRFEFDYETLDLVKIDDLYEFPDRIDLSPYLDDDLPSEFKNQNWNYKLHGVLVHQGSVSNGHYYAMIKPNHDDNWLRFDDDKVWKVTPSQVFQENFGANEVPEEELLSLTRAEHQEYLIRRATSAYMLVYYRETELDRILPKDENSIEKVIPDHIPNQIKYELELAERLESVRQEALYYTIIKMITLENFNNYSGFDLTIDSKNVKSFDTSLIGTPVAPAPIKLKKTDSYDALMQIIASELGYEVEPNGSYPFRLLVTTHRNNQTNRTDVPITEELKEFSIQSICSKVFNKKHDDQVFFVEEANKDIREINKIVSVKLSSKVEEFKFDNVFEKIHTIGSKASTEVEFKDISEFSNYVLLFIKYFDPISQDVRGIGHIAVAKDEKVGSLVQPVGEFLGFNGDVGFKLYEELSPIKIEAVDEDLTFEKSELTNGDIIIFQPSNASELAGAKSFRDAKDFFRFQLTKLHIQVKPCKVNADEEDSDFVVEEETSNSSESADVTLVEKAPKTKLIDMWVSSLYTYQELAKAITDHIDGKVNPEHLRLFILDNQGQRFSLKTRHSLSDFFPKQVNVNQIINFEYEILNINLKEYESFKAVKIHWLTSIIQSQVFELLVPMNGKVSDLIQKLLHKVNVPKKDYKHILVWSGSNHSYVDLIRFNDGLDSIHDDTELYAGVFPVEVEILVNHALYTRFDNGVVDIEELDDDFTKKEMGLAKKYANSLNMLPAFHFYKTSNYHHGNPFVFPVYPEETFEATKERLRKRLGLGIQAFEKMKFALADNDDKGAYIDGDKKLLILFDEIGKSSTSFSLALDHPDRNPRRQHPLDKGISIK